MKKMIFAVSALLIALIIGNAFANKQVLTQLGTGWRITDGFDVEGQIGQVPGQQAGLILHYDSTSHEVNQVTAYCVGKGFCMQVNDEGYLEVDWPGKIDPKMILTTDKEVPLYKNEKRAKK